jgi:hypothetical protein
VSDDLERRARDLIARCDGITEAGFPDLARESRYLAGELLRTLDDLAAERSARLAVQAARDRALAMLAEPGPEDDEP